ncbi:hypothetical protein GYMLUDRAFT_242865 [Collybiopsis luxurians FD-317 M1]|uniref:Uncharacterized protein n=1 Tax=Collybiopsis luxurians FD-317 M1 TaxID=944289 RepID=A0A0D0CSA5_9AGAR|nr:hypothetical protein GYMLUDRAFT_242865 [Collybiopsis luxurians FD-317 M1]
MTKFVSYFLSHSAHANVNCVFFSGLFHSLSCSGRPIRPNTRYPSKSYTDLDDPHVRASFSLPSINQKIASNSVFSYSSTTLKPGSDHPPDIDITAIDVDVDATGEGSHLSDAPFVRVADYPSSSDASADSNAFEIIPRDISESSTSFCFDEDIHCQDVAMPSQESDLHCNHLPSESSGHFDGPVPSSRSSVAPPSESCSLPLSGSPSCDIFGRALVSHPSTPCQSGLPFPVSDSCASNSPTVSPHKRTIHSPSPSQTPSSVSSDLPSKHLKPVPSESPSSSLGVVPKYIFFRGVKFFADPDHLSPSASPSTVSLHSHDSTPRRIQSSVPALRYTSDSVFSEVAESLPKVHHIITDEELDTLDMNLPDTLDDILALRPLPSSPSLNRLNTPSASPAPASRPSSVVTVVSRQPSCRSGASASRMAAIARGLTDYSVPVSSPIASASSLHCSPSALTVSSPSSESAVSHNTSCPTSNDPALSSSLMPSASPVCFSVSVNPESFANVPEYDSDIEICEAPSTVVAADIVSSDISFATHTESDSLFDDGGMGASGCLRQHIMAPELIKSYQNVKNRLMPVVYPIASTGVPTDDLDWLSFSDIFSSASRTVRRSLLSCVTFTHCACWINPSRADPSCVTTVIMEKGPHLIPSEDGHFTAVFLTSGIVKCSCLYNPVIFESGSNKRMLRQLDLTPFEQEAQLLLRFFAAALNFSEIALAVSEGVVMFSSIQQFSSEIKGNPNDYTPSRSIPTRPRPPFYVDGDPRLKLWAQFPYATPFSSPIPVYDGCTSGSDTAFEFGPNQLHELGLGSYPLYKGGMVDLLQGSLVIIGYTAHSFPTTCHYRDISSALSLNIAFIILLSLPGSGDLLDLPVLPKKPLSASKSLPHSSMPAPSSSRAGHILSGPSSCPLATDHVSSMHSANLLSSSLQVHSPSVSGGYVDAHRALAGNSVHTNTSPSRIPCQTDCAAPSESLEYYEDYH